jgi:hypothetical protein
MLPVAPAGVVAVLSSQQAYVWRAGDGFIRRADLADAMMQDFKRQIAETLHKCGKA